MFVTKEAIEKVRSSQDLVSVIESRGVALTRKGRNFVGLCPFHEDHAPSLVVNPARQLWNCFGACRGKGAKSGGDVFAFVSKSDGVTFLEAMKKLGYEEPKVQPGRSARTSSSAAPAKPEESSPPRNRAELLRRVVEHYHRVFRESATPQEYLKSRGLVDAGMFAGFEVGYADGSLLTTFDAKGDVARALREIGVLTAGGRELLHDCVVFPLTLPDVGVVDLYGRHVKRDQHLYLPGPRRGVFHWQAMKGASEIILTESVLDAATLHQTGFKNVSCVYGTQGYTSDHEELLQRFRVKRVTLCLDGDDAGEKAAEEIGARIGKLGIEVVPAKLEGAKDANELLVTLGAEAAAPAFRKTLLPSPPLTVKDTVKGKPEPQVTREDGGGWRVAFGTRTYRVRGVTSTGLDRLRVNLRVEEGERLHLDTLDLYAHRSRAALVKELSRLFEREEGELASEVASLIETLEGVRLETAKKPAEPPRTPRIELTDREKEEALKLLRAPDLMDRVLADFERAGCVGERTTLTVGYLGTISRLLEDPLGLMIVSRSGAGKSSLQDALCDFVPEEDLVKYTRLTGQALFYKEEDSLVHKVLAVDEEKGAEEAAYSIRNLQSAQMLSIAATRTDPQTGKLRTEEYKVKGPVFILFTTTSPEAMDYETRNRFVQAGVDESSEQTRKILKRQREGDTLEGVLRREERSFIRKKHHNVQRLLRPLRVVNPYAAALAYPDERLQMRREQKKYLTLIKTIALLHQHQREVKRARRGDVEVEYVEVAASDIALANELARKVLGRSLDELAHPTRELLKHLVELTASGAERGRFFTRQEVREATGWSDWQVRVHLSHLLELEYVVIASGRIGKRMTYELLFEGDAEEEGRFLTGLVDVEELTRHRATAGSNGDGARIVPAIKPAAANLVRKSATL